MASSGTENTMASIILLLPILFCSPRLGALPPLIWGYGRETTTIRIEFSCVDGGFPKKQKMPTWFGFMNYKLFSIISGLDVVFTIYLLFGKGGDEVGFQAIP
ncbi:hypothetical protein HOY80DRAFT_979020 [Tuber brumale]|nr:hypothetical protein HOY80DRAFT_979020 [Tuber brumale]